MKTKLYLSILIALSLYCFSGCSTTQETAKETPQTESTEIKTPVDTLTPPPAMVAKQTVYIVQIGAFNTEEKANTFAAGARSKVSREITVSFSPAVNLYVVQAAPFGTRKEAEDFRNDLWLKMEFNDAFILTEER